VFNVIKQCTEKETTSLSNFLLTFKLNCLHDLKIMFQCLLHLITCFIEITPIFWWVVIWNFCNLCLGWVDLYVIIPVHGIGSIKTTRGQITCYCPRKMLQLWELLYTYVIKQCTEKETTSLSNFLLAIKLNYLHDLNIMLQCLLHLNMYM
jgi:hypothetical protein